MTWQPVAPLAQARLAQLLVVAMVANISCFHCEGSRLNCESVRPTAMFCLFVRIRAGVQEGIWGLNGRRRNRKERKRSRAREEPSLTLLLTPRSSRCDKDPQNFAEPFKIVVCHHSPRRGGDVTAAVCLVVGENKSYERILLKFW